jgi:hypothetical protein
VPLAQAAHERLKNASAGKKNASAPPSQGQVFNSPKVHRREGHLASVQTKMIIFTLFFCSSTECSSPAATVSHRRRQRSGHRPEHHGKVRATHSERRRGQRAAHKERRRGQQPGHHDQVPTTNNCRGKPPGHHD